MIHFETLRQYLRMEFFECKEKMSFEFDMDHICDDWVVLMTLIGNDYLPGLPNFDLDHNVLTMIYDIYKILLTTSNGSYRFTVYSVFKIVVIIFFWFLIFEYLFRIHKRKRIFEFGSFCSAAFCFERKRI